MLCHPFCYPAPVQARYSNGPPTLHPPCPANTPSHAPHKQGGQHHPPTLPSCSDRPGPNTAALPENASGPTLPNTAPTLPLDQSQARDHTRASERLGSVGLAHFGSVGSVAPLTSSALYSYYAVLRGGEMLKERRATFRRGSNKKKPRVPNFCWGSHRRESIRCTFKVKKQTSKSVEEITRVY